MYPVGEEGGGGRRARGFALALVGTFVYIVSSVAIVSLTHQAVYLGVAGLSLGAVLLTYMAARRSSLSGQVVFLIAASCALAAEASVVMIYFPQAPAVAYTLVTLVGSYVSLKGVRDIEMLVLEQPYPRRRREIPAVQEGV